MFNTSCRLALLSLFFITLNAYSQSIYYPLTASFIQPGVYGTARIQGLGGCGVAMGADLSCASMNPAGLGLYNKNDIGVTFSGGSANTSTAYTTDTETSNSSSNRAWVSMPNIGASFHHVPQNPNTAFKGGTFAITYNKTANFQNQIGYSGIDNNHSMMEYLTEQSNYSGSSVAQANADSPDPNGSVQTYAGLAYNSGLVGANYGSGTNQFASNFPLTGSQNQGTATTKRGQYAWNIAYGFNLNNRFYLGATVGITVLNYILQTDHLETVLPIPTNSPQQNNLINFEYQDQDQSRSTAINLKIGAQYKVSDRFRIAGTIMTPTSQKVNENYSINLSSLYYAPFGTSQNSLNLSSQYFSYKYVAPPRAEVGATFLLNRSGLITAGAEYLPYKLTYFNNPSFFSQPGLNTFDSGNNTAIQTNFRNVFNLKGGIELRSGINYFRAGCAYIPSPYKPSYNNLEGDQWVKGTGDQLNLTAGWGVRTSNFYFDLTAINTRFKSQYMPYNLYNYPNSVTYAPVASNHTSIIQLIATFGILY